MMPPEPHPVRRKILRLLALTAGLALGTWLVLGPWQPYARWLHVETPSVAHPGVRFPVLIRLLAPPQGRFLHVDLHVRQQPDRRPEVIASSRLDLPSPLPASLALEFNLPTNLTHVSSLSCVVYTTDSGRWIDHRLAAHSDSIPLQPADAVSLERNLSMRNRPVFPLDPRPSTPSLPHPGVRIVESLLFFGSALLLHFGARANPGPGGARRRGLAWSVAYLVAAFLAATDAGPRAAEFARQLATDWSLYEGRQTLQRMLTAISIAGACWMGVGGATGATRFGPGPIARAALTAWIALQGLNAISLHGFDSLHLTMIPPLSRFDVLRLLLAALATPWLGRSGPRN